MDETMDSGTERPSIIPDPAPAPSPILDCPAAQLTPSERQRILRRQKRELVRKLTFENWPSTVVRPDDLARAGFFYFSDGDNVQCAYCLGIIGSWEPQDVPLSEHRRHFPR